MPLNRFITFVKPYINLVAGAIAAWLVAKANVLGISGLGANGNELQTGIAAALAWLVTQGVTELGDMKWLKGHHLAMTGDAQVQAAVLTAAPSPVAVPHAEHDEHEMLAGPEEDDLPSDEEEFATAGLEAPDTGPIEASEPEPDYGLDEEFDALADDLPDDEDEFAAPPPDETNMPVQPSQIHMEGVPA